MKKILVIDDEIDICIILQRFLSRNDFDVSIAHNGRDGLDAIRKKKFDLIISDYRLPDFDGLSLLKEMKSIDSSLRIIIITGYSDIRLAVEVIKYGAVDYITKPLYPEELLSLINNSISGGNDTSDKSKSGENIVNREPLSGYKKSAVKSAPPQRKDYIIGKSK